MKSHVNTRSITKDYRYLGEKPDVDWLSAYTELTSFEHPTIIFEKENQNFRLFLSGMPSTRKDKVGTDIRYSFLFTGDLSEYNQLKGLVTAWAVALDDNSNLAQKLGDLYHEDEVHHMVEAGVFDENAQAKLCDWLATFTTTEHAFTQKINEISADNGSICQLYFIDGEQDVSDISVKQPTEIWLNQSKRFVSKNPKPVISKPVNINTPNTTTQVPTEGENGMGKSQMIKTMIIISAIIALILILVLSNL